MKSKTILTVMLTLVYLFALKIFYAFQGSIGSQIGVNQLDDSAATYGLSDLFLNADVSLAMHIVFIVILGIMWVPTVITFIKKQTGEK